ncbi:sigma factor-like helix-turn-helix DNA-binding protein [Yinghuangia seranimata]|uniref:sigma factor-like helix-turn-helix DNA-binding protein n=1 Tax=Yinghuangia seranimata TaxID=408067 RepID=UPI00248C5008|nr:sigma factor-like helix-turn-helix DNA-binding protein [Yinghuangia seranimata]MDI2127967.1 sigma factor-like helix-turn-helix DNA-binding protein [Yinghuangia seranimata]
MGEEDWLVGRFDQDRDRLRAVARRMLGSGREAEAALWAARTRLGQAEGGDSVAGWLTSAVVGASLDALLARPAGGHRPEPAIGHEDPPEPELAALLADSVGLALLNALGTLTPDERMAFILHDVFAVPYTELGALLSSSPAAAERLARSARARVRRTTPPPELPWDADPAACGGPGG